MRSDKSEKRIAIIGTSIGQSGLYRTAKRMGIKTLGFSLPGNNDYSHLADRHYRISVDEIKEIVEICRQNKVCGVVSNGSDFTAKCANRIAYELGLPCNDPEDFMAASNKGFVRSQTRDIAELTPVGCAVFDEGYVPRFPCIIKPQTAGGKSGLSIARDRESFEQAIKYAMSVAPGEILIEDYIEGQELSVETLSADGQHYVIQTCDADTSGDPHFVEIAHHLPANISDNVLAKIKRVVPKILDSIGFKNGATDIEMKVDANENIYLIEVNLRGAGGNITNDLVPLSTGYDYLQGLIEISCGEFVKPQRLENHYAGDYYLCSQTADMLPLFKVDRSCPWLVDTTVVPEMFDNLPEVKTNADRKGYIIYKSDHKITLEYV